MVFISVVVKIPGVDVASNDPTIVVKTMPVFPVN
jgi:hypothetical protein